MKKQKQIWITALGCLLAICIISAQLFIFTTKVDGDDVVKTEQSSADTGTDEKQTIGIASFSIPSPIHVEIRLDSHVLFEILFENKAEQPSATSEVSHSSQKFLVTLFRVIISPNAP